MLFSFCSNLERAYGYFGEGARYTVRFVEDFAHGDARRGDRTSTASGGFPLDRLIKVDFVAVCARVKVSWVPNVLVDIEVLDQRRAAVKGIFLLRRVRSY